MSQAVKIQVGGDFTRLRSQLAQQINLINKSFKINIPITTKLAQTANNMQGVATATNKVADANKKATDTSKKMTDGLNNTAKSAKTLSTGMATLDGTIKNAVGRMGDAVVKAGLWAVAMGALYGSLRLVRTGVEFLLELDKSLTEISIVTGMTREETYKLAQEYNGLARTMGQLTQDITDASVAFFRQGKTMEQTMNLTRASLIASSIANIDMADASEYLTSSLNGFMWTSQQAIDVIDKFAKISSSAGTSFEELAIGFQKANSSAYSAGLTFDELASYMATVSEVTRESSSSIGNSLKTIITRFGKIADLGKLEEDGITATLNGIDASLRRVGVTMRDETTGQIRDLGRIIRDLGGQWANLEINQRNAIAFQIAGVRQMNRFIALMDNYGRALELMYKSITAQGTALQQYNAYMQSTEFQIKRLKAEFEGFFLSLNGNGGIIRDTISYFADLIGFFRNLSQAISSSKESILAFKVVLTVLATAIFPLAPAFMGWAGAIIAIGGALGYVGKQIKPAEQAMKEYADANKDLVANQKSTIESTEELAKRLESMAKAEDGTIKNKQELEYWYNAIETIQPKILEGLDKEKSKYEDLKNIIKDLTQAKKDDLAQTMLNVKMDILDIEKRISDIQESAKIENLNVDGSDWELTRTMRATSTELPKLQKKLEEMKKVYEELQSVEAKSPPFEDEPSSGGGGGTGSATTATTKYTSALEDYFNILQKISNLESELSQMETMKSMVSDEDALKITEMQIQKTNDLINLQKQLSSEQQLTKDSLINSFKPYDKIVKISDDFSRLIVDTKEYNKLNDSQKEKLDGLIGTFDGLRSAMNSTNSEILKLQKNKKELISSFESMADTIAKNIVNMYTNYYQEIKKQAIESNQEQIESEKKKNNEIIENLKKQLDLYEEIIDAKIKALDKEQDEESYNKRINKLLESKQKVQDKINVLSMDNSTQAKKQREELALELGNIEEELANEQNDREYQLRKDNLKDLKDNYKQQMESKMEAEKTKLDTVISSLEQEASYYDSYYDSLIEKEANYNDIRREILNNNLSKIKADMEKFIAEMPSINTNDIMKDISIAEKVGESYQSVQTSSGAKDMVLASRLVTDAGRVGFDVRTGQLLTTATESQMSARKYLDETFAGGASAYAKSQAERFKEIGVYHDGGIVGGKSFNYNTEKISKLLLGELVLNKEQLMRVPKIINDQVEAKSDSLVNKININIANLTGDRNGATEMVSIFKNELENKYGIKFS